MGKHASKEVSFKLEGKFLGFEFEDGDRKYLRLENLEGEYYSIKLAKHLRLFKLDLQPGDWVQIAGEKKFNSKNGSLKLKAELIITSEQANSAPPVTKPAKAANILVCQKSTCMKQGGKAVCQALQAAISDRGLENQVAIKGTGCLKQCKAGPNLIMPDKTRYCRIQADQIPKVIDRHFPAASADEQTKHKEIATVATQHRR